MTRGDRCRECGKADDLALEVRRQISRAKTAAVNDTRYGRACRALLVHYEQAALALEAASKRWSDYLVSLKGDRPLPVDDPAPADEWVIIDTRGVVGNSASFWRPEGAGYTCDLRKAGRYTREQAEAQHRCRETDMPARLADLLPMAEQHVDLQNYRNRMAAPEPVETIQEVELEDVTPKCRTCDDLGLVSRPGPAGVPHTERCPDCGGPAT